jgi:hypothetical protein
MIPSFHAIHLSTPSFNIKVHRISNDYQEAELLEAFKGQDVVIATIATAEQKNQEKSWMQFSKAGAKRFVSCLCHVFFKYFHHGAR